VGEISVFTKNRTLVFLHIQKCAGNTLIGLLESHFKPNDILKGHLLHGKALQIRRPPREYRLIAGHNTYDDIAAMPIDPVYITMLRDPIKRVVSLYYFWRSHRSEYVEKHDLRGPRLAKKLSFAEFIESDEPQAQFNVNNGQARQFMNGLRGPVGLSEQKFLDKAQRRLAECAFVGITEQFDQSVELLCYILGWTVPGKMQRLNTSRINEQDDPRYEPVDREPISKELMCRLAERNRVDSELYRFGAHLFRHKFNTMNEELASGAGSVGTRRPLFRYRIRRFAGRLRAISKQPYQNRK
jgi:hypothetical protein